MHFPVPDPAYTASASARAHFRLAVRIALGFVALLWLVQSLNWGFGLDPDPFAVRPRQPAGLIGVAFAPLVHGGFEHLIANTPPLAVLGAAMLYLYPSASLRVLPLVYFGPGLLVWLFGRASAHLGASGLIYGLAAYVFFAGVLRRDRRAIAASLAVVFMYGSLVLGLLPAQPGISWETHLAAAILGTAAAFVWRKLDVPPPKRYAWEEEGAASAPAVDDDRERR
jgi:membrane associated rhomboid family serine protease